ncbi:DEAD/DEAH box helicase [Methanorbis rubei]|uniref:ATP-dependent RNA helicase RhlB n=1 Tax=Methanorbis rubei TaxID=3028300 RepID=A0AAE4MH28_9EURY|nr:ATP-dependent RNA helicase RhlB [Methanocorpusculaceae archaeon Cs1]
MTLFESFHPTLQEVLLSGLGWSDLRPVQEETCRAVADGADVVVLAPTAGGKTESAFIPAIDALLKSGSRGLGIIYISPLKALINDQEDRIRMMCERAGLMVASQHGDVAARDRWKFSGEGDLPNILLTTPESLEVLLGDPDSRPAFSAVRFVIIDEIHAFMETDRGVHLRCLLDRIEFSKNRVQRIGLSATVGNPAELLGWMSGPARKQRLIHIPSEKKPKQFTFVVEEDFSLQVRAVASAVRGKKALVFVDSRSFAERLMGPLAELVPNVHIHHSSVSADDRAVAEAAFDQSGGTCVICTSTMELGIDIGDLDLVVQYGPPKTVASFLQRLGRTGRRGRPATMTFVLERPCDLLISAAAIESAMLHEAEPLHAPAHAYHVMVQQLFLLLKSRYGSLSRKTIFSALHSLSPFAAVPLEKISELLEYLADSDYLSRDGDLFSAGPRAERELGKSNWLALISVIHDAGGFLAVLPDGTVVGTLDPRFVGSEPGKTFSFTGKSWRLLFRDDVHKRALVEPAAHPGDAKRPFWSGSGSGRAGDASPTVCRAVCRILERGATILPLPNDQKEMLSDLIRMLPDDFGPGIVHVRAEPEVAGWSVVIATFLGARANMVLARLLKNRLDGGGRHTLRYDQFAIRIFDWEGADAAEKVAKILLEISEADLSALAAELPELPDTTWKFGSMLPKEMIAEMTADEYYRLPEVVAGISSVRVSDGH